ncbi:MAG: PAS domain-containing protein, partial [Clostridia bacterium]|nr:PAS domain-containing protein [Deltaproteobacteria bacterium]
LSVTFADVTVASRPLVYVNPAFATLTGYDQIEMLGQNCRFLQGPNTAPEQIALFSAALKAALPVRLSIQNYRKDGSEFTNDVSLEPIVDAMGIPVLYVGIQRDADDGMSDDQYTALCETMLDTIERRKNEIFSARQFHGSLTQAVLQTIPSRIIAVNVEGVVGFVNRAALILLERALYDVIGKPITAVLDRSEIDKWCDPAIPPGEHRFELTWMSPSGVRRELGISMVRLDSRHAGEVSRVFVFRDLGEWRQHELELRRIKGLNALGQMAAGFAHEVRNPLAAMRSLAEALRSEIPSGDSRAEYPTRMLHLVTRVDALVKSALRFGAPKPPSFRICTAARIVEESIEVLRPRLGSGPKPLVEMDVGLPDLRVDESQAVEVLMNLVENALDAVGEPERVRVRVLREDESSLLGRFVRIDVTDDGPGMGNEALQRVFDPFFTTKPKGTGLGLAIAQRLARDNGGHLIAASVPNVETTFSLLLPIAGLADDSNTFESL